MNKKETNVSVTTIWNCKDTRMIWTMCQYGTSSSLTTEDNETGIMKRCRFTNTDTALSEMFARLQAHSPVLVISVYHQQQAEYQAGPQAHRAEFSCCQQQHDNE